MPRIQDLEETDQSVEILVALELRKHFFPFTSDFSNFP